MIALSERKKSKIGDSDWHADFLAMLPRIRSFAKHKFRRLPIDLRDELVQEAIASSFQAYRRLVELGKRELAFPTVLARFAVKQVRAGRRVGGKTRPSDVMSESAQRRNGFQVGQLQQYDPDQQAWREIVVEDGRATPAEVAACRIDFADWLKTLSKRERKIVLTLASGEKTSAAAQKFGVTAARISQLRGWLRQSWQRFHGEIAAPCREAVVC